MKNREILLEINRMRSIMGLSDKPLILEQPGGRSKLGRIFGILDDILTGTPPEGITRVDLNGGQAARIDFPSGNSIDLPQSSLGRVRNAVENGIPFNQMDDATKADLLNILDSGGFLKGDDLYDDVIDDYLSNGGREDLWLEDIQRQLNSVNPRTGKASTLEEVLANQFGDMYFASKVKPTVQRKIADLKDGKLVPDSQGRLVSRDAADVSDFNKQVKPLTPDEIKALANPTFVQKMKNFFKTGQEISDELKSLYKNLMEPGIGSKEKEEITKLILAKTRQLANWKVSTFAELKRFIAELSNSSDITNQNLAKTLKEIEEKNGGWDVLRRTAEDYSGWEKEWVAMKEAMFSAMSAERTFLRFLQIKRGLEAIVAWGRRVLGYPPVELTKYVDDGTFKNTLLKGSPRGWPSQKVYDELSGDVEKSVDYFKKLRDLGGMPLAAKSYAYEWLIRLFKYKLYWAFVQVALQKWIYEAGLSEKEVACTKDLVKVMLKNKIYDVDPLVRAYEKGVTWLPPCLKEIPKNKIGWVFSCADYMASAGSEDGIFWSKEVRENMSQISWARSITDLVPGFWDNIAYDAGKFINDWLNTSDLSGPKINEEYVIPPSWNIYYSGKTGFESFCQVHFLTYQGFDESTGIGTTTAGKKYNWRYTQTFQGEKVGVWDEVGAPQPVDTTIDTVDELYAAYPYLREDNSQITLNSDKTFDAKFPDGRILTILIKNGKAYWSKSDGVPYPEPLPEIKPR